MEFKGGEIKDVSDITKGRTTTHIEVENHSVPKSLDDRAMNSVHNFDIYIVHKPHKPQKKKKILLN